MDTPTTTHDAALAQAWQLHSAGRLDEARRRYEKVLRRRPRDAAALRLLGAALSQQGRHAAACDLLERSLRVEPGHEETLLNLARVAMSAGRHDRAAQAGFELLRRQPGHPGAHVVIATLYQERGRHGEALAHCVQALEGDPQLLGAWEAAGLAAMSLGQLDVADDFFRRALALEPSDTMAMSNRGLIRLRRGDLAGSYAWSERALAIDPGTPVAWNNRGVALKDLGRVDEALGCFRLAGTLRQDYADPYNNIANAWAMLGRTDLADAAFDEALRRRPGMLDARFNRSMVWLLAGRWDRAWAEYETRFVRAGMVGTGSGAPQWRGAEPLAGRTLAIVHEQGLGDSLQFCRYALLARDAGARVLVVVPKAIQRLLRSLGEDERLQVVGHGDLLPAHDLQCPMLSLPLAFGTTVDTVPGPSPYLRAEPADVARWRERLGDDGRLKVGLVWSGGFRADQPELWPVNSRRNIPLEKLAPLALEGVRFISLQKGEDSEAQLRQLQADGWDGPAIEDHTALFGDFADTAALIETLDLVIAVDTSTAHVAGALGKPVWMLNRMDTCWRWLLDSQDTPWYPSMRLYRQPALGAWEPVVARVRDDLAARAAAHRAARGT